MRILVLHSRYRSGPASGENRVVEDEAELLLRGGHEVDVWSPTPEPDHAVGLAASAVWNRRAGRTLASRIRTEGIDVVHVHNLFPMFSPSVLPAAARAGAGVVMTLHNFRLMCLPATLLRDGAICELCVGRVPWRGVAYGCYRGSRPASAAVAASLTVHRLSGSFDAVDRFVAVSEFVRDQHVRAGLPRDRLIVKPNFTWSVPEVPRPGAGEYFLYLGRLAQEKGVAHALEAWDAAIPYGLVVAGDGPLEERLRRSAPPNVEFLGRVGAEVADDLVARARAVIVPSICYEGASRVTAEANAAGVPTLASRIGALPEFVAHDVSGLLFEPADSAGIRAAVLRLCSDAEVRRLGRGASERWRAKHSPDASLKALEQVYAEAVR